MAEVSQQHNGEASGHRPPATGASCWACSDKSQGPGLLRLECWKKTNKIQGNSGTPTGKLLFSSYQYFHLFYNFFFLFHQTHPRRLLSHPQEHSCMQNNENVKEYTRLVYRTCANAYPRASVPVVLSWLCSFKFFLLFFLSSSHWASFACLNRCFTAKRCYWRYELTVRRPNGIPSARKKKAESCECFQADPSKVVIQPPSRDMMLCMFTTQEFVTDKESCMEDITACHSMLLFFFLLLLY